MPSYIVTDPESGKKLKLTGDSPPSEQELEEAFASVKTTREFPQELQNTSSQAPASGTSDAFANQQRQAIGLGATPKPLEGRSSGISAGFKAGFVRDPETKIRIFANEIFPNDPEAIKRFGIVDNEVVYIDDDGNLKKAESGFGAKTGAVLANAPEAIGGMIGSLATGNPVTGAIIGDVGGRAIKQGIGSLVFDEPQTPKGNIVDLGKEGAIAAVGGGLGKLGSSFLNRRAIKDFDKFRANDAINIQKRIKSTTGIDLDVAQASQLVGLKQIRKWAMKYPSDAAETLENFSKLQAGQSEQAVEGILNTLSKKSNLQQLGESGINAAKASIDLAKQQREEIASPFYKEAFKSGVKVDIKPLADKVDSLIKASKGDVKSDLIKVRSFFANESKRPPVETIDAQGLRKVITRDLEDNLEGLHGAKIAIDAMLSKRAGATAAENQSKRYLTQIQKDLVDTLANASPEYEAGRAAFEKASKELVNPLEDSAIGALAKIDNRKAARAASALFSETPNPEAVRFAKVVIKSKDPQAWRDLVRAKLQTDLEKAMKLTQTGEVVNLQGKFLQNAAGTKSKREALQAALDDDVIERTGQVLEAFEMIANSPIGGSDTAFNQAITEQQKSAVSTLGKLLTPKQSLVDSVESRFIQNHAEAIAQALTDPTQVKKLNKILELPKGAERAIAIVSTVLPARAGQALTSSTSDIKPGSIQQ